MKKFLALITCLILLCIGTVQAKESKVSGQPKIEQSCIDVGKVPKVHFIGFNQITDAGQTMPDSYIKRTEEQSIDQHILQKEALCCQYRLIPECQIEFIGKVKTKYITHYTCNFTNPYNHPPVQ
ncbi:MAG: hypothetical protein LBQ74_00010 [Prevotella sp.]|jgi:hypothetical protein|nr:hypothetical protein [Prevotella sp.]